MKYSIFKSLESELETALKELNTPPAPILSVQPSHDVSVSELQKMSYLLKFSPGGYYSHLLPDNRYK
jgi:hypothetical protein